MNTWGLICTVPLQPFYVSLGISILEPFHTGVCAVSRIGN